MKNKYINFTFENLEYDKYSFRGTFKATDLGICCDFKYNRNTEEIQIWNSTKRKIEILPIPFWWLEEKLKENGKLEKTESRICY